MIGRYRVRSVLGTGGFATVYLAADAALDHDVAIKVLDADHAADLDLRTRFIDEARTMRRLDSAHLVTIHDIGEGDGQPHIVMSAHTAGTLRSRLDDVAGPIEHDQITRIVDQIARCLEPVHAAGIVHRDVTPSNLLIGGNSDTRSAGELLGPDERLVLGDFGIARSKQLTGLTVGAGTVGYMAPEQGRPSIDIDERADLYAATQIVDDLARRASPDVAHRLAGPVERGSSASPNARPASIDAWRTEMHAALTPRSPLTGRRAVAALMLLAVIAAITGFVVLQPSDSNDATLPPPQIIGPDELLLGDAAEYTHQDRAGSTYTWTLPDGRTSEALRVSVVADDLDGVTIRLTESVGQISRESTLTISVRSR